MSGADNNGFGDFPQRGFAAGAPMEVYEGLYRLVLTVYGHRCALSGTRFEPAPGLLHPDLDIVALQPREHGGPLAISNYLPVVNALSTDFVTGSILIEDDYRIIVPNTDLLSPENLALLRNSLHLPAEKIFRPAQTHLAYHRRFSRGR
ncbi:hypothetical protein FF80_03827 [Devosia sp. LC5]|uniref:hypothetical protein n=1 Tax=Devosia sp. LC5 TaxID=1502724 RepID=UPI0004E34823|nr:hypothetical protein [Devosia sp. LC5]KFC62122.1 hypothetical protein FF80_03827 [Devosia sp. LC5]